jgi:mRNA interferase MazF
VQNDVGNANAPTTIVVPFTTSFGEQLYPFEVLVSAQECALREDSVALCSQIRTVSIEHRIAENLGSIPHERMDEVGTALEYSRPHRDLRGSDERLRSFQRHVFPT